MGMIDLLCATQRAEGSSFVSPTLMMILAYQNKTSYSFALQPKCLPCLPAVTAGRELGCYECISPESAKSYKCHALNGMPSWLGGTLQRPEDRTTACLPTKFLPETLYEAVNAY